MRQLGQLEALVMRRLWTWEHPVAVREVLEDLQRDRDIAYTTVMTVLDNLHTKGLLTRQRDGRAYRYRPTMTREQHTSALLEDVLATSEDRGAALLHFVGDLPDDDLAELRVALNRLEDRA